MNWLKQTWVTIVAVVCALVSIVLFALQGFAKVDVAPFIDAIWAVVDIVGMLILAIKKLLEKKDESKKKN